MNNPVLNEAMKRAIITACIVAAGVFFTLFGTTDDWRAIISGTGVAFFGPLGLRGLLEGKVDTDRAAEGKVIAGDVPEASKKLIVTKV